MPQADAAALQPVQSLLRQLREIKGVREVRPGVFQVRSIAFIQFITRPMAPARSPSMPIRKPGWSTTPTASVSRSSETATTPGSAEDRLSTERERQA